MRAVRALYEKCISQYGQVSSIFRKFDWRGKGQVSFSDFAFGVEELGLGWDREQMMQVFAHLDRDADGQLNKNDFVFLCQEGSSGFAISSGPAP
jgi:Ca2+-binding EF-hand superfamily protein